MTEERAMSCENVNLPQGTKSKRPDFWDMPKCQAKAKSTGERCKNIAVNGKRVCYLHGGKSTGPKTDKGRMRSKYARLRHGDYSEKVKRNRRGLKECLRYFKAIGWLK
jgi:hypothetical protein